MKGTVKFFHSYRGWGFLTDSEGKDVFVHHSNILMDGFRSLDEGDIVSFELGAGNDGREQAVNVTPILTMAMVKNALKEKNLHIVIDPNACDANKYAVIDENEITQTSDDGITFLELAAYAGFDTEGIAGQRRTQIQ